jgi:hypothetical protein
MTAVGEQPHGWNQKIRKNYAKSALIITESKLPRTTHEEFEDESTGVERPELGKLEAKEADERLGVGSIG